MRPIDFDDATDIYAEDQPEYLPLRVEKVPGKEGEIISVWKPTFKERIAILFGNNIGLSVWTFHKRLSPLRIFITDCKEKKGKQE